MLRGNLSTRPFYNERLATIAIWGIGLLVLVLTVFNATRLIALASERRTVNARIARDQGEAAAIRAQANTGAQQVDRTALTQLASATREANDLIDQRTFSWTAFFGLVERTLPLDVRLVSVSPRVERGTFHVTMIVVARSLQDVASFIEALRNTGAFYDTAAVEQQRRDDGAYNASIEASYLPPGASPRTASPQARPAAAAPSPETAAPSAAPPRAPR